MRRWQHCVRSKVFIVLFPVLILVPMAYPSFLDLPVWRDRPPSQAFFDFDRYEYRLRLCPSCRHMRHYCAQRMPKHVFFLNFDRDFRGHEEPEIRIIHTGADYIAGQTVGHEDPSGTPAWIVIWDTSPRRGRPGRFNARATRASSRYCQNAARSMPYLVGAK